MQPVPGSVSDPVVCQIQLNRDVARHRSPSDFDGSGQYGIQVDGNEGNTAVTSVGQELTRKVCSLFTGATNSCQVFTNTCWVRVGKQLGEFGIAGNADQQIVEVMSNTSGNEAQTFHLTNGLQRCIHAHALRLFVNEERGQFRIHEA